jgi:sporulation protein YlmC with PRC-barrel domain
MSERSTRPSIDIGAEALGSDGTELGKIAYVVVRPPEFEITDVVVSTGRFLGRDIVVPIERVKKAADGRTRLDLAKSELEKLDDYVEAHYERPPEGWFSAMGPYYPGSGTLWPIGSYYPIPTSVTVNAPEGTVGLRDGMEVESSDGHKVGTVRSVRTDERTREVTAIVVHHGLIAGKDAVFPVSDIKEAQEDKVILRLAQDEARRRFEA